MNGQFLYCSLRVSVRRKQFSDKDSLFTFSEAQIDDKNEGIKFIYVTTFNRYFKKI